MTEVYLAGPMLNHMDHNVAQFREWTSKLRARGFRVEAPHEWDRDHGFDVRGTGFEEDDAPKMLDMRAAMAHSMNFICTVADVLAVLPQWERSLGATAQVYTAWRMRVPVHSVSNLCGIGPELLIHNELAIVPGKATIGNRY